MTMLPAATSQVRSLQEIITAEVSREDFNLPVFSPVAMRLQQSLGDPDFSLDELEKLVLEDAGLAGQVLKTANSAFYRGMGDIITVKQAILRLGSQQVANIAMLVSQRQAYQSNDPQLRHLMEKLWRHSFASAIGCQYIFKRYGGDACVAFLGGLLHDVGKLGILKVLEQVRRDNVQASGLTGEALLDLLNGPLHTQCGYALAQAWNLPDPFLGLLKDHHAADIGKTQPLMAAVRLMNLICDHMGLNIQQQQQALPAASPEARILGLSEIQLAELEVHIEDTLAQAEL